MHSVDTHRFPSMEASIYVERKCTPVTMLLCQHVYNIYVVIGGSWAIQAKVHYTLKYRRFNLWNQFHLLKSFLEDYGGKVMHLIGLWFQVTAYLHFHRKIQYFFAQLHLKYRFEINFLLFWLMIRFLRYSQCFEE